MLERSDYKWLLVLLVLGSGSASTSELKLRVVDANGISLKDAMASLRPAAGRAPKLAQGTAAVMDQRDLHFIPHVLPIQFGTKVLMSNTDQVRHHVYSFSPAKHFELRTYRDRPGDPGDFLIPGDDGRVKVAGVRDGEYVLDVWHPRQPGSDHVSAPITITPDIAGKTVSLRVEPAEEPAHPSELELKFSRYQAKPDAR